MTNPHPIAPTAIDIRGTADRVIASLQLGRNEDALQLLEQSRRSERPVVQEAIERYVVAAAGPRLEAMHSLVVMGTATAMVWRSSEDATALERVETLAPFVPLLERLHQTANHSPRHPVHEFQVNGAEPVPNELAGLTEAQRYDVYASIVHLHGTQAARDALGRPGEKLILGLRQENRTTDAGTNHRAGQGIYDDRILVLWTDTDGRRQLFEALRGNTEPTAQYDHHAGSNGRRQGARPNAVVLPSAGFEGVGLHVRKVEGEDRDADGLRDLGRLADGTIEMRATTHNNPGAVPDFSLRPTSNAVRAGQGGVQRDTNGDGYFTAADVNGVDDLNNSFKIHSGSRTNTDSAGCQTMHPDDYRSFVLKVTGVENPNPAHYPDDRWQYVLVTTSPGLFRGVEARVDSSEEQVREPTVDVPPQPAGQQPGPPQARNEAGPRLSPLLQEMFDAGMRGDRPGFDSAMRQNAQAYFASALGAELLREAQAMARGVEQAQLHAQAQSPMEEQRAVAGTARGRGF